MREIIVMCINRTFPISHATYFLLHINRNKHATHKKHTTEFTDMELKTELVFNCGIVCPITYYIKYIILYIEL